MKLKSSNRVRKIKYLSERTSYFNSGWEFSQLREAGQGI